MAYTQSFTIGTTRQLVLPVDGSAQEVHLHSSSGKVYIGGSDVTTSNGFALDNGEKMTMTLHPGDAIYAVTASGTVGLTILWLVR